MDYQDSQTAEFPEVIVMEASAGAGKTYALAKRYLQLLINPHIKPKQLPLRNILAITFTNKATLEMKERILELLKRIALNSFESPQQEQDIFDTLRVSKSFAQRRAAIIMDELINSYTFFQVQTIDSLINTILLGSALRLGHSANFKIKRDYSQHLAYCLDRVIEEAATQREVSSLLGEFLRHYLFVENRKSWFPKRDILELMQSLFKLSNTYGGIFTSPQGSSSEVIKKKRTLFRAIKKVASEFPQGVKGTAKNAVLRFSRTAESTFEIKKIPDIFRYPCAPMNKGKKAPGKFSQKWRKINQAVKELAELDAVVAYKPYIKLFKELLNFFQKLSKKQDVLFLEELNYQARRLFSHEDLTVAELYYRLATHFIHYLIDEFQDTSLLQWRNLKLMIEEALSSGGTLFYVGDKKQAIYRFRGGEARLFDEVKDKFSRYNVKESFLKRNWRSQKAIVEFNNEVFSPQNLKEVFRRIDIGKEIGEDLSARERILRVLQDSQQDYKPDSIYGYVEVERIEENSRQSRDAIIKDKLIYLMQELNGRFSYRDIAVLCRDNQEVEMVTSWFLEADIPVESEKTLNVKENSLIKEIICFLRFLNSPIDDLSFASFLLGEIFSKSAGLTHSEIADFLFNLHKERRKDNLSLYHRFRKRYPEVWRSYFDEFFKSVGFISPYELVVSIYSRFRVGENFQDNQAFFMKFLELIKSQEEEYAGLPEFLDYLDNALKDDLYVNVAESNSASVLTIHKSKGLEFGVVITPFLRMEVIPETGGKTSSSFITFCEKNTLKMLRITKEHRKYSSLLGEIYKEAYIGGFIDELNSIYVALTRAKFELYIFLPKKSGMSYNKARCLIPECFRQRGEKRVYPPQKKKESCQVFYLPPSQYQDWVELLKDEFVDPAAVKNRNKIMQGNALHFALSCLERVHIKDKTALKQAIESAKVAFPSIRDYRFIEEKVRLLLDKEQLRPFFSVEGGEVYREKEIVTASGEAKRIDRLIVKEKEVWVADFKSSRENHKMHLRQIKEYLEAVRELYPRHYVRGFLIYIDEAAVEEVKEP